MPKKYVKVAPCTPLFSDEDADLDALRWRTDRKGYAGRATQIRRDGKVIHVTTIAHRVVGERIAGRPLTKDDVVDHIDFNRLNNRRDNLRVVTRQQSAQHRRAFSKCGLRGVVQLRSGKWRANAFTNGRLYGNGVYSTPEEAGVAAAQLRERLGFLGAR